MTSVRPLARSLLALIGVFVATGCYSYRPIESPSPGTTVRIQVPLRSAVSNPNQAPETLQMEGIVLSAGDSIVLQTTTRRELGTFRVLTGVDTLRVARSGLAGMQEQVFSPAKTYGLTAAAVAGAAGLTLALVNTAGGREGSGRGDGPVITGSFRLLPILSGLFRLAGG